MKFQILDNLEEEMVKAICEVIDLSKELDIAVGYFYESGYREIAQKIYDLLQRGGCVRLIIGGSPDQATAATLKALYNLRNVEIRVIVDRFFHSKLYIGKNDYAYILHGSSNISIGGLKHNIEFNTLNIVPIGSEMAIKTRDWFEDLWNSAIILTEDMIKYYVSVVNPKYEVIFKSEYSEELLIELEKLLKEFKINNVNYWINNLKKFQISDPRDYTVRYFANRVKYGSVEVLGNIIPFEFQINDAMEIVERFKKGYKGVLVAHDVGLGKTITTGMALKSLLNQKLIKRVLILVPVSLIDQWKQKELENKFNEVFEEVDNQNVDNGKAWGIYNKIIASIDFAVSKRQSEHIKNSYWDVLVIDEAHLLRNHNTVSFARSISMLH